MVAIEEIEGDNRFPAYLTGFPLLFHAGITQEYTFLPLLGS
jgi:hypothetical protein